MPNYNAPGVYVREERNLGNIVSQVPTAIPVFVGYTQIEPSVGHNVPVRIENIKDFFTLFGGEPPAGDRQPTVNLNSAYRPSSVTYQLNYFLVSAIRMFYANGGGTAYIVSVDIYADGPVDSAKLITGINSLETADEPTLLLVPDAHALADKAQIGNVHKAMLAHCSTMKDRFSIMDVKDNSDALITVATEAGDFRGEVGNAYLSYGAAYYPNIQSSIGPMSDLAVADINMATTTNPSYTLSNLASDTNDPVLLAYTGKAADAGLIMNQTAINVARSAFDSNASELADVLDQLTQIKTRIDYVLNINTASIASPFLAAMIEDAKVVGGPIDSMLQILWEIDEGWQFVPTSSGAVGVFFPIDFPAYTFPSISSLPPLFGSPVDQDDAATIVSPTNEAIFEQIMVFMEELLATNEYWGEDDRLLTGHAIFSKIAHAANTSGYVLPPSGAVAGIYNRVDANRGVWKAPANESVNLVSGANRLISPDDLADLNIDGDGKSINAIRDMRGRGTLVYGARSLDGNSGEWKFINVRRTFIMIEESISKSLQATVFEGNTAQTWVQVKSMIESFLTGMWRQGALAGSTPKEAFQVKVGLGSTMTSQDILNGRLIVEVALAAVRPAEFIVLEFVHKLQVS